jgi:hypothetical protein
MPLFTEACFSRLFFYAHAKSEAYFLKEIKEIKDMAE